MNVTLKDKGKGLAKSVGKFKFGNFRAPKIIFIGH